MERKDYYRVNMKLRIFLNVVFALVLIFNFELISRGMLACGSLLLLVSCGKIIFDIFSTENFFDIFSTEKDKPISATICRSCAVSIRPNNQYCLSCFEKQEKLTVIPGVGQETARKLISIKLDSVSKISRASKIKLQNAGISEVIAKRIVAASKITQAKTTQSKTTQSKTTQSKITQAKRRTNEQWKCKICAVNLSWNRDYCTSCRPSHCNICRKPISISYDACISCVPNQKPNYLSDNLGPNHQRRLSTTSSNTHQRSKSSNSTNQDEKTIGVVGIAARVILLPVAIIGGIFFLGSSDNNTKGPP